MNFELKDPTPNTDDWRREKGIHKYSFVSIAILIFFSIAYVFLFFVTLNFQEEKPVVKKSVLIDWEGTKDDEAMPGEFTE